MTAEAQRIVDVIASAPEPAVATELGVEMDTFGRTVDERTIELESNDAEAINNEVEQGKHRTYSDALHYVLGRGFAEIKRTREAARALAEKTLLKAKRDNWSKMLESNPALIQNQELLTAMCRELGILPQSK